MGICCITQGIKPSALGQSRHAGWGVRGEGGLRGRECMADSCWCMAETNTILWKNYPPIKNKTKFKKIKLHLRNHMHKY